MNSANKTNSETIRAVFDVWVASRGKDISCFYNIVHDDVAISTRLADQFQTAPGRPLSGRQLLRAYLEYMQQQMEMVEFRLLRIVEKDDLVVTIGESAWRIVKTGRIVRSTVVKLFRFEDGLVIRYENWLDTAAMREAQRWPNNPAPLSLARPVLMDRG